MDSEPTVYHHKVVSLEDVLERIGAGRFQWPLICATGLTWMGDAMELTVIAFVLPVLAVEWNVPQATADSLASIMFVGMLVGALLWGIFTDHYGRRAGWLITTSITAVGGVLSAGAPDGGIFIFLGLRALVGLGLSGTNLGFALCSELLPRRSRGPLLMWFELFFVAGSVVEVLLVWLLLRRPAGWRWVLLLSTLPLWLALGLARRVPESPRWLTTRGKSASAAALLRHAAITNGQPPPLGPAEALAVAAPCYTGAPSEPCDEDGGAHDGAPVPRVSERCELHGCARYGAFDAAAATAAHVGSVFHPSLRLASAALCAGWFLLTFTYFGMIFVTPKLLATALPPAASANANATDASGTSDADYATSLLATVGEVPGLLLATATIDRAGRVRTVSGGTLIVAAALGLMALVILVSGQGSMEAAVVLVALVVVGRAAAFGSYSALYVLSAERLPTRLRATGFGLVSAASRLAGAATSYVAGGVWAASPATALSCYAGAAALCAAIIGCMDDTRSRAMPEEIEELREELSSGDLRLRPNERLGNG
jgi:putative MFS transporter